MTQIRIVSAVQQRAEIMVASLFLITAAASIYGVIVLHPILEVPNYLAQIFTNKASVAWGALLWSINNIGIVFIAVFMFPLLKSFDETMAISYLTLRIIEGTVMMFGIAATLMLIPLSGEFIQAGVPVNSWYQTLADSLLQAKFMCLTEVSLPILGLGGCIFSWQLFRFTMVPKFISLFGLLGYSLILFGGIAAWFGIIDPTPGGSGTVFAIPVALFEIILLPFWLFFRGFAISEEITM